MQTNFTRILGAVFLLSMVTPAFSHGSHDAGLSAPMQHVYAHIGSAWMILISLIILGKLGMLFGRCLRRSGVGGG